MALRTGSVWPPTKRTAGWPKLTLVGCALLTFACQSSPVGPPPSPGQDGSSTLTVVPPSAALQLGDSLQFSAQILDEAGTPVPVEAVWVASGGSIDANGLFRAGSQTGTFEVVATGAGEAVGKALVSVLQSGSSAAAIEIAPEPASVLAGDLLSFTASVTDDSGDPVGANITWSATGGEIDQVGRYSAGAEPGVFAVIAWETSGLADTVEVEVLEGGSPSPPPPPPPSPPPPPGGEVPTGPNGSWNLVFDDEFDGNSLDSSRWECGQFFGWSVINGERQWYDCDGVSVAGGFLTLTATKDGAPNQPGSVTYDPPLEWTSGAVFTRGKFEPQYGAFEARVQCPTESGMWCAYWTFSSAGNWPNGEIDFLEVPNVEPSGGSCPSQTAYFSVHFGSDDGSSHSYNGSHYAASAGQMQVYTVEWTPTEIVWYVNGVERHRYSGSGVPDEPVYLILNMAVGGSWPCSPTGSGLHEMRVDYVRAWER